MRRGWLRWARTPSARSERLRHHKQLHWLPVLLWRSVHRQAGYQDAMRQRQRLPRQLLRRRSVQSAAEAGPYLVLGRAVREHLDERYEGCHRRASPAGPYPARDARHTHLQHRQRISRARTHTPLEPATAPTAAAAASRTVATCRVPRGHRPIPTLAGKSSTRESSTTAVAAVRGLCSSTRCSNTSRRGFLSGTTCRHSARTRSST